MPNWFWRKLHALCKCKEVEGKWCSDEWGEDVGYCLDRYWLGDAAL